MALRPCRKCGRTVSSIAKKCPHCGVWLAAVLRKRRFSGEHEGVVILAAVFLAVCATVISAVWLGGGRRKSIAPQRRSTTPSAPQSPRKPSCPA